MNRNFLKTILSCLAISLLVACSLQKPLAKKGDYLLAGQGDHWELQQYEVTIVPDKIIWGGGQLHYTGNKEELQGIKDFEMFISRNLAGEEERVHSKVIHHGVGETSLYDDVHIPDNLAFDTLENALEYSDHNGTRSDLADLSITVKWGTWSHMQEETFDLELVAEP